MDFIFFNNQIIVESSLRPILIFKSNESFTSSTIKHLQQRFLFSTPEDRLIDIIDQMVQGSVNSWTTKLYDQFQYLTNGIL